MAAIAVVREALGAGLERIFCAVPYPIITYLRILAMIKPKAGFGKLPAKRAAFWLELTALFALDEERDEKGPLRAVMC